MCADRPDIDEQAEQISVSPYPGLPSLYLANNADSIEATGVWYRTFEYDAERERGLDFQEDLFNPCVLRFDPNSSARATVIASTEPRKTTAAEEYRQRELLRRRNITQQSPVGDEFVRALTAAADQYIVSRGDQRSVIAGYHWFSDWGRDTMIPPRSYTSYQTLRGRPQHFAYICTAR
jgi:predicted glycogen debranching enzyme